MLWVKRIKKYIPIVCEWLEVVVAVFVLLGIILAFGSLMKNTQIFHELLNNTDSFREYLEQIFTLVIGIEFLEMLCRPSSENVIEVLIFLMARHVIVEHTTSAENFISALGVCLLCVVRRYLRVNKGKRKEARDDEAED